MTDGNIAPEETRAAQAPVLVVDMDGTLLRTDTLHEALFETVSDTPARLPAMVGWLAGGKAAFKRRLADLHIADPAALPVNEAVVAHVRAARAEGRRVVLVSAADRRQVAAVAEAVGLFDEAHGTDPAEGPNLSGAAKARFLTARYGAGGFDYMGDSRADLPVWAAARRAITVGAGPALRAAAEAAEPDGAGRTGPARDRVAHIAPPAAATERLKARARALRPHQWLKNVLVFMPALAAHAPGALWPAALAFVCFSLTASSVYLLNDLLDLRADRAHPRKRTRPFAAGTLALAEGAVLAPLLLVAALALAALTLPLAFLGVLGLYYAATLAYSITLKRRLIIDIWVLAGLYTVRILAGAAATGLVLSPWMLGFSMFLFLALAAVKRQAELVDQQAAGGSGASGRAYRVEDLPIIAGMAIAGGYVAVLVFALYLNSADVQELYARPVVLWGVCPILLYWISRMVMITHRGGMTDDPLVFAARDRVSWAVVALSAGTILAAGPL